MTVSDVITWTTRGRLVPCPDWFLHARTDDLDEGAGLFRRAVEWCACAPVRRHHLRHLEALDSDET
jgi:hypothetical protein